MTHRICIAEPLYMLAGHIQSELGQPRQKDAALLQKLGSLLKGHYGEDIFAANACARIRAIKYITPQHNIIVTDLRFPSELTALRAEGFVTVRVNRLGRPIDRDPNHISETALDGHELDHTIDNTGTLEEYQAKVEACIDTCARGEHKKQCAPRA